MEDKKRFVWDNSTQKIRDNLYDRGYGGTQWMIDDLIELSNNLEDENKYLRRLLYVAEQGINNYAPISFVMRFREEMEDLDNLEEWRKTWGDNRRREGEYE